GPGVEGELDRQLGGAVGVDRSEGRGFGDGDALGTAVDGGGGGEQPGADAGVARQLEEGEGARDVDVEVEGRIAHRFADLDLAREVSDRGDPAALEDAAHEGAIGDVADDDLDG